MTTDTRSTDLPWPDLPTRRGLLAGAAGAVALLAVPGLPAVAVPVGRDRARYLDEDQLATLAGVVDRVVPADDGAPGALAARAHESIDALLGAFRTDPPRIYAGGPFSDRGGARRNDFERFLPLDAYERKAWKRRVRRLQKVYTRGLDALASSVPGFADLPGPLRDLALIRQTSLEFDSLKPQQVVDRLKPLAVEGAPWFGSAGELVAVAYMKMGKNDLAGPMFAAMAKDENVPQSIRSRARQMAGLLGIDAVETPAEPVQG